MYESDIATGVTSDVSVSAVVASARSEAIVNVTLVPRFVAFVEPTSTSES